MASKHYWGPGLVVAALRGGGSRPYVPFSVQRARLLKVEKPTDRRRIFVVCRPIVNLDQGVTPLTTTLQILLFNQRL